MGVTDGFAVVSRRRFLKYSLSAGGLLLMGGGGLLALRGRAPSVEGLRSLGAHEYRTLFALATAVLPSGGAFEHGAGEADLARKFDAFLVDEPPWNVRDLKRALLLLEFGPLLFERRLATFSKLAEEARREHFEAWCSAPQALRRQVAVAFRKFLFLVFYDDPRAWKPIGYDGPMFPVPEPQP